MTREQKLKIIEKRRRRRRIRIIRRCIKIGIYAVMALLAFLIIWKVIIPLFPKGNGKDKAMEVQAEVIGPGNAMRVTYRGENGVQGWNVDGTGWWYLNEDNTYFASGWQTIDGEEYYFTQNGYMATGWLSIDGESHFFTVSGTEEPDAKQKLVAITYDDGPSQNTDRLLDCLEENGAKATFFVVGTQVEQYPETLQRMDEMGMEIGSHTYDHTYLYQVDAATIEEKMRLNEEVITGILGHGTTIMRPTGGGVNDTVRATINEPMIHWDVDTLDWSHRNAQTTVNTILEQVEDGSIILMHDLYSATVDASEIIIPELIKQGYKLVTVSELAELRGVTLEAGEVYYDFYLPEDMPVEGTEQTVEENANEENAA